MTNLENHLHGEYAGERIIEIVENFISKAALLYRIFGGQRYAAQADDYHDEKIKVRQIHYPVSSASNPMSRWETQVNFGSIHC